MTEETEDQRRERNREQWREQDEVVALAVTNGAISGARTPAGRALRMLVNDNPVEAREFATASRSPLERAEMVASIRHNMSFAMVRRLVAETTGGDVDQALINLYGA